MSHPGQQVLVAGAGVIGTACAHFLETLGYSVILADRGPVYAQASYGNCGNICPSHLLPLAQPGVIGQALTALAQRSAPFFLAPRIDLPLWRWLLRFGGNCRRNRMIHSGHAALALLRESRHLYDGLLDEYALECEWDSSGSLYVFERSHALQRFAATAELLQTEYGIEAHFVTAGALAAMEPALRPGLAGAWYFPGDAHLRPDRLLACWRQSLRSRGIRFMEHTGVQGLVFRDGRACAARTSRGEIEADFFVFATGAMTPFLSREIGWQVPIQPAKGYSLTMPRPRCSPRVALHLVDYGVVVTPMRSGCRLGSVLEFSGYNRRVDLRRVALLRSAARACLVEPLTEPVEQPWVGWRSMTPDGLPRIGPCPTAPNLYLAAGHNMLGMSMAPATGQLIAQMIDRQVPTVDPTPYRLLQ